MEPKGRNVGIAVIVLLVIACCCVLVMGVAVAGWLTSRYAGTWGEPLDLGPLQRERVEQTFALGDAPSLEITNFAGAVTVRAGEGDLIRVVATKTATSRSRLEGIKVEMNETGGQLVIRTSKDFSGGNASVELEIAAPAASRVRVDTGAGEVDVRDITGQIDVHSGAGTVGVRGAESTVRVELGAGQIIYEGAPRGDCRFQTGAGEIILRLPEDPNVRIDVGSGLGAINVAFEVDGRVSTRSAEGVIGDGRQGSIYAHTGVGSVNVWRR